MTTEEKIVAAIERCNASIEQQTAWLKVEEEDPLLPALGDFRLAQVSQGILQWFINAKVDAGLSPQSVVHLPPTTRER